VKPSANLSELAVLVASGRMTFNFSRWRAAVQSDRGLERGAHCRSEIEDRFLMSAIDGSRLIRRAPFLAATNFLDAPQDLSAIDQGCTLVCWATASERSVTVG
jgi:hypothetical protein